MAHIAVSDPITINHVEKIENIQKRMNELKQMMVDLQKNETKESESYPNVSFMSTDNFEREKPRIKAPSALSNAMKGEKSLGAILIRKKKNRIQISDTNLSNLKLTQAQMNLLSRGLKFIPTPVQTKFT